MRTRSASASSLVVIAPPSPKPPRFLDGKKLNVASAPSAPGRPAGVVEPAACAASSTTGTPSAAISATGATLPNRCTAITAFVRGVSAARTVSGVTQNVSGSTSQNTGRGAGRRDRLRARVERERRDDDLVAGPDAERAQRDRQRVGAVGDADGVRARRSTPRTRDSKAATSGPRMYLPPSSTRGDRGVELAAQRRERRPGVEQGDGHAAQATRPGPRASYPAAPMHRVLVTGGAGTIGAAVVRRLLRDPDWEVRVSDQRAAPGGCARAARSTRATCATPTRRARRSPAARTSSTSRRSSAGSRTSTSSRTRSPT